MVPKGWGRIELPYDVVHWLTVVIKEMNNQVQYKEEFALNKADNVRIT